MISKEKVVNYKVVDPIEVYSFRFGCLLSEVVCTIQKNWISKFEGFKQNSRTINNLKWKSINYKVIDLIKIYNFDIEFVFILLYLKMLWILLCCTIVITDVSYNKLTVKNVFTVNSYGQATVMRSTSTPPVDGANRLWLWTITSGW